MQHAWMEQMAPEWQPLPSKQPAEHSQRWKFPAWMPLLPRLGVGIALQGCSKAKLALLLSESHSRCSTPRTTHRTSL